MAVRITKIQFLANRDSGEPIFYCHANDKDHDPRLNVVVESNCVEIVGEGLLFKVKRNPQTKNRVDIYMPISSANELGRQLADLTPSVVASEWRTSPASPGRFASGRMALPEIVWSKYSKALNVVAETDSGTLMVKRDAYVNVDLETPHGSHIMMRNAEVHIGIALDSPVGSHDEALTYPVDVPEGELQRGTGETNPVYKVSGCFLVRLTPQVAAGLGQLLMAVSAPS